jgi:hypothetical protein
LHNFEGDDNSLYEIVPRADAYRLVHLLDGHDPFLIVPSNDLSFIVVDSWEDSILRTIHLGDVPVVTELTGPHTLDGIHPTELSNDETFLVVERHYVRGIEELFYVLTDGSGPVIPTRISPEIPFGAGAWPLRRWVTSPDFDELVLLHPAVPFARDRRLGVFIVDLENPEAGSISIDPTAGPDPYGESESFETCGYDPSGRWRFAVGDPETRDLQTFYVWRRSDGRVRATWQEISDNLIAEFLANGDWASLVSSTSVRLVNVTEAFDEE